MKYLTTTILCGLAILSGCSESSKPVEAADQSKNVGEVVGSEKEAASAQDHDHHDDDHKDSERHDNHSEDDSEHDEDHEGDGIRQLESHVHGGASLALALDGEILSVELDSPLFNLTGFEYEAVTEADKTILHEAEETLSSPGNVLMFNMEAMCHPAQERYEISLRDDHDDDHDDHDDDHAEDSHSDAILNYSFNCKSPDKLEFMSTELFALFPNMEDLEVIYLGPILQIQGELSPANHTLKLRR